VWHLFVVRTQERDRVQRHLKEAGIDTVIHYPIAPHQQEAYRDLGFAKDAFPIANQLAGEVLSLPIGPYLTDDQQSRVITALQECSAKQRA
jgi:dTDP-4-amino-4,6-dideoxygalactose transaminase